MDVSQELRKGGFSEGGFCRIQCQAHDDKQILRDMAPAAHLTLRQPQPKKAYIVQKPPSKNPLLLVPDFRMFFFSARKRGRGSPRRQEGGGGGRLSIESRRRGVGVFRRGRGREGVCGELGNFWGGGVLNIFFGGRNVHKEMVDSRNISFRLNLVGGEHSLIAC